MNYRPLALTIAAGTAALAPAVASANHIDFFEEGNQALFLIGGITGTSDSSNVSEGSLNPEFPDTGDSIIGNDRFAQIEFDPGPVAGTNFGARVNTGDGVFSYSNDPGTQGTLTLRYGDSGTLNLVDPVNYQFLGIDIANLGQSGGADDFFTLNVTATDTGSDSDTESILINQEIKYFIPYAAFDDVDFDSIDSITFEFVSGNLGADLQIEALTREIIPEPASLALLGLGSGLLVLRRRKAR